MITLLFLLLAQSPDALNDRAQQLAQTGRAAEAAAIWRQLPPEYFPAAFNLGFYHYSRQEFAESAPYLERAAKTRPADFNTRFLLGQVRSALSERDGALRAWRAALTVQPNHAKLLGIVAVEYGKGGYYAEAASAAKRALALRPDDVDTHVLAVKACQDAQDPEGPALARRAAAKFPDSARAQFEHAWYLQRAGRAAEAAKVLESAMRLDPSYEEPHFFYGGILLDEDRVEAALIPLRKAVALRPTYTGASVALGRALMELERYVEAVAALEAAMAADAAHPQPPLMLSRLYFRQGDEAKARRMKDLSLRLRRENAALMDRPQAREFR